jgi:hypothetical protein
MSDTADPQGDFTIERVADAENDSERGEQEAAPEAGKREHGRDAESGAASSQKAAQMARADGLPARVRRKYYVVAEERAKEGGALKARIYADERGEYLAFKALENRLTTRLASAQVIHDMVAVAEHRNWQTIRVHGSMEFRREAWLEASARGMEVKGYEATQLDRQALAHRRTSRDRANPRPSESRAQANVNRSKSADRFHSRNAGDTPDNVTVIDANGKQRADRHGTPQHPWRGSAERFRVADRKAGARDADLVAAQSQLTIIEKALERALPHDPRARERILGAARERVAQHLEQGRSFERAMVRERATGYYRPQSEQTEANRTFEEVREKTRQRER